MVRCIRSVTEKLNISREQIDSFSESLISWGNENSRSFPWRVSSNPYSLIVAEILLQKTRAEKVAKIYPGFITIYPTIYSLAQASIKDIEHTIGALGITYRSARLKEMAQIIIKEHGGLIPDNKENLLSLPGVGIYAANAVLCFAYNQREPIIDPTIARVYERIFSFISQRTKVTRDREMWLLAEELLPQYRVKELNYALLDFGALICTSKSPRHNECPVKELCRMTNNGI